MDAWVWILIIILLVIFLMIPIYGSNNNFDSCTCTCTKFSHNENFGQDPSIRMGAGVGGPNYGDPIGQFADQIAQIYIQKENECAMHQTEQERRQCSSRLSAYREILQ